MGRSQGSPQYVDNSRLPLGLNYERRVGTDPDLYNFARAYVNVNNLGVEQLGSRYKSSNHHYLPRALSLSLNMLWEWHEGRLRAQKPDVKEDLAASLEEFANMALNKPRENLNDIRPTQLLDGTVEPMPSTTESAYTLSLWILWMYEFFWYDEEIIDDNFLEFLYKQRQTCLNYAACQRVAHAVLPGLINNIPRPPSVIDGVIIGEPDIGSSLEICPWLPETNLPSKSDESQLNKCRYDRKKHPRFLWDIDKGRTIDISGLDEVPAYGIISHTWGRWSRQNEDGSKICAQVAFVPWPLPENTIFEVVQLPQLLKKVKMLPRQDFIWLDLVCIPQQGAPKKLFKLMDLEIAKQASIFRLASHAMLWLNTVDDWSNTRAAIEWLSMDYLSRTHSPTVTNRDGRHWQERLSAIQSIDSKSGIGSCQQVLQSLSPEQEEEQKLGSKSGINVFQKVLQSLLLEQEGEQELLQKRASLRTVQDKNGVKRQAAVFDVKPNGWFTSLWTLQEACLRPDMVLCDRDFNLLQVGECRQTISLDTLSVLLKESDVGSFMVTDISPKDSRPNDHRVELQAKDISLIPGVVKELFGTFTASGLIDIVDLSPLDILSLGRQRFYKKNRVPALVSVLGLGDWFIKTAGSQKKFQKDASEEKLINNLYSQSFLEAVRQRYGAAFFATTQSKVRQHALKVRPIPGVNRALISIDNYTDVQGSALPTRNGCRSQRYRPPGTIDHPSVSTWVLKDNGNLNMPEIALLTTSEGPAPQVEIPALLSLQGFNEHADSYVGEVFAQDLHTALKVSSKWTGQDLWAVVVMFNLTSKFRTQGIILRKFDDVNIFIKQGTFTTFNIPNKLGHPIPPSSKIQNSWVY